MAEKFTIAFLIRSLNYGGAERQLVTLANELFRHGHQVSVVVFYPNGVFEQELKRVGIPVFSLNKQGRWDLIGFLWKLTRVLRHVRPDVLHGCMGTANMLGGIVKLLNPRTRLIWWTVSAQMDLSLYDWLSRVLYAVEPRMSWLADLIISNSFSGKGYLIKQGVPEDKITVIPNGFDTYVFKPDPLMRAQVRAEWEVAENECLIGLVARIDPIKDHRTFLKAASILASRRKNVRFVCVGDGDKVYKVRLEQLGDELGLSGLLLWAGNYNNMPAAYNALDCLTSSSISEGLSNVIGEAMACGVPCVTTDVGDSAFIVGDQGVVVPVRDPEALASGWERCLKREKREGSLACRRRIISYFGMEKLVQDTEQAIVRLLKSAHNPTKHGSF